MLKEIECCFQMATRYWAILKYDLIKHEFGSRDEEVRFFKEIKPLFTGEIEYYSLLYHAELFLVDTVKEDQLMFLERQSQRLEKFSQEHDEFYACYKSGCTAHDRDWFVRTREDQESINGNKGYDREEKATSSHDHLVASLLALERYHDYVTRLLAGLHHHD